MKGKILPKFKDSTEIVKRRIQLVQERRYTEVHVYSCLITMQQSIFRCGIHSHSSIVSGEMFHYVYYMMKEPTGMHVVSEQ